MKIQIASPLGSTVTVWSVNTNIHEYNVTICCGNCERVTSIVLLPNQKDILLLVYVYVRACVHMCVITGRFSYIHNGSKHNITGRES